MLSMKTQKFRFERNVKNIEIKSFTSIFKNCFLYILFYYGIFFNNKKTFLLNKENSIFKNNIFFNKCMKVHFRTVFWDVLWAGCVSNHYFTSNVFFNVFYFCAEIFIFPTVAEKGPFTHER